MKIKVDKLTALGNESTNNLICQIRTCGNLCVAETIELTIFNLSAGPRVLKKRRISKKNRAIRDYFYIYFDVYLYEIFWKFALKLLNIL